MRKAAVSLTVAALTVSGLVATAVPASARTICDGGYSYKFSNESTVWEPTNVHSDWAQPGITITYNKTTTGTWSATGTATVGADAGVIFAKVSTQLSFSVGRQWSKTDSWSYSGTVRGNQRGRLMMYHKAASFTVSKIEQYTNCRTSTVYTTHMTAPAAENDNTWGIQY
ncbi:hypothetical protein ACIRYZ_37945 [Kitasatospora sp. NPDC101155]|uniref:hypothetical protein n=1 Tax=Kitasatospora sp. NPDC101155 TaxID=3364097 RepID=UPI0037F105B9